MYIHKIVIDTNCINARGNLQDMNRLEEYHDAGVIEILKTSTLNKDFSKVPFFKNKADKFQTISGSSHFAGLDDGHPEALHGGIIDNPIPGLFRELFPEEKSVKDLHRSIRDSLHIEQAFLNYCDYFVTDETRLIKKCQEIPEISNRIKVTTPSTCLDDIKKYFLSYLGDDNPENLKTKLKSEGPIILGSNSCYGFRATDATNGDIILSAHVEDSKLLIEAVFFDKSGAKQLEIFPGSKSVFSIPGICITCGGRGGIVVGESVVNHFMIGSEIEVKLAARVTHVGRVVFFIVNMNGSNPKNLLCVNRECLTLEGVNFG